MSIESRKHQYGKVFDHWQIRQRLGKGSGGKTAVFELVHTETSEVKSALKVVNLLEETGSLSDFSPKRRRDYEAARDACSESAQKEVLLMSLLQGSPNIVTYLDHTFVDWADEDGFGRDMLIRMELLKDLRREMDQGRTFPEADILRLGKDLCAALVLCHSKDILHRDIKPENIFLNQQGCFKLGDFGISRIIGTATVAQASTGIGTLAYAAPEQLTGRYDTRVDIYSLGLVLYELSNRNRLPFAGSSYVRSQEIQQRLDGTPMPDPCDASPALARVIRKACAYRPQDRFQTAQEFLDALSWVESGSSVDTQPALDYPTGTIFEVRSPRESSYETQPAKGGVYETAPAEGSAYTTHFAQGLPEKAPASPKKTSFPAKNLLIAGAAALVLLLGVGLLSGGEEEDTPPEETSIVTEPVLASPELQPSELPQETTVSGSIGQHAKTPTETIMETSGLIAAGGRQTTVILPDGTAVSTGDSQYGACNVSGWSDLKMVVSGDYYTAGLRNDGTVVAVGNNNYGQCNVSGWQNITAIAAGDFHLVGLCEDGTLVAAGCNSDGEGDVWVLTAAAGDRTITAIAAGYQHTVALYSDGTVRAIGDNKHGQCNVSGWTDVVAVYAGVCFTVGLRSDGTVLAVGDNTDGQCNVSGWSDVVMVSAGDYFTVAVTGDGQILATGQSAAGQQNFSGWSDVIAIGAGCRHTVAITADGRILATGENKFGQLNVSQTAYQ